jgi:plastocyanin
MTRASLALLAALAATAAGCGGSDPLESDPVATAQVTRPKSYRFDPPVIEVGPGATVTWENEDSFTHTVRFDGDSETAKLEPGESLSREFPEQGAFHYVCTLHPHDMEGEVLVGQ